MSYLSRITSTNPTFWSNNAVFVQLLGLTPILAASTSLAEGLVLSLLTSLVFLLSALLAFFIKPITKEASRLYIYLLILALFTTLFDLVLQFYWYQIYIELGNYLPLICCNVILLIQLIKIETLKSIKHVMHSSTNTMCGFIFAMLALSALREFIGNGSLLNNWRLLVPASTDILPYDTEPKLLYFAVLQPGALLFLGLLIAVINWFNLNSSKAKNMSPVKPANRARVTGKP